MHTTTTKTEKDMTTLGQIVGIHKGTRHSVQSQFDAAYHTLQKGDLFTGFDKIHTPLEGNLQQPADGRRVQANAHEILTGLEPLLMDLTLTKDVADTEATADVVVDGSVLLADVPVSHLLWLEKQAAHLLAVFQAIPVQSAAENWATANNLPVGQYRTDTVETESTRKNHEWITVVPNSPEHAAQIRENVQDVVSGHWRTVKYTAALPVAQRTELVARAGKLLDAIKMAVTEANHQTVTDEHEGAAIFGFLFDGVLRNG
jgi:hypothetical protein